MAPRLRKDLVATTADDQGVACVEVTDPSSGTTFRFYDFEYALAQQLDGKPLEDVVAWASVTYGVELTPDTLTQFLDQLAGLGFLAEGNGGAQPAIVAPYAPSPGAFAAGGISPPPTLVTAAPPEFSEARDASEQLPSSSWDRSQADLWFRFPPEAAAAPAPLAEAPLTSPRNPDPRAQPSVLLPRLEVLASPLPPVVEAKASASALDEPPPVVLQEHLPVLPPAPAASPVFPTFPVTVGLSGSGPAFATPTAPLRMPASAPLAAASDTPLGSIARALADAVAPPPGAIDVAGEPPAAIPPSTPALPALALGDVGTGNWISDLARAVDPDGRREEGDRSAVEPPSNDSRREAGPVAGSHDRPTAPETATTPDATARPEVLVDRRQPPRPEVVVMPPVAAPPPAKAPPRRGWFAFLAVLLIGGGLGAAVWFMRPETGPPPPVSSADTAPRVHAVAPQPTTFYGWFETVGVVSPAQDETLSFRAHGRAQEILPAGTTFAAGESVARLQGAGERELAVNRLRSRIAFYEQLRDSSRAEGSPEAIRQAEAKLAARKHELLAAQAALAELEIRPKVAGEIVQLLVGKGALLKVGMPVLRVRSTTPRATFAVTADEATRARALSFCRLETIPGTGDGPDGSAHESKSRPIDCVLPPVPVLVAGAALGPAGPRDSRFVVDLLGTTGVAPGTQVRLASARYDGVFPVPQAAVVHDGDVDHVWIVSGGGRFAERRTVELASTIDALALIGHGLSVGDSVVIDPPATLKAGGEINVVR